MCTNHKHVTLRCSCTDKCLESICSEYFHVLFFLFLHICHHVVEIHSNLSSSFQILFLFCSTLLHSLHLCHHLCSVTCGDCSYLDSHIRLIDGADIMHQIAQLLCYILTIVLERLYGCFILPTAILNQPFWRCEMHHRHDRLYPIFSAACKNFTVMFNLVLIIDTLLWLDSCPFNREAICIQTGFCDHLDILFITVVMIHRI